MVKIVKNFQKLNKIEKEIKYLKRYGLIIGIFGSKAEKEHDGVKVIDYAKSLEYGTFFMPERPFFRTATSTRRAQREILEVQKDLLRSVYMGEITGKQALDQLGVYVSQKIKDRIMSNDFEPLKEATVKKKKRNKNNILRENDFLLDSVNFEIVKL